MDAGGRVGEEIGEGSGNLSEIRKKPASWWESRLG